MATVLINYSLEKKKFYASLSEFSEELFNYLKNAPESRWSDKEKHFILPSSSSNATYLEKLNGAAVFKGYTPRWRSKNNIEPF